MPRIGVFPWLMGLSWFGVVVDRQIALARHEPGPAASEEKGRCARELLFELVEAPELSGDGVRHRASRLASLFQGRPEEAVVDVTAAVVAHGRANVLRDLVQVAHELFDGEFLERGVAFDRGVELVDVGLVVLGVMDLHGARVDERLQRVVCIFDFRQCVSHWVPPFSVAIRPPGRMAHACPRKRPVINHLERRRAPVKAVRAGRSPPGHLCGN